MTQIGSSAPSERGDRPDVSIVVPVYNEVENVPYLCVAVREALAEWDRSYELICVDDGSDDGTLEELRKQVSGSSRLRVLSLETNSGQTRALAVGFAHARGGIVVSMDGDMQNDPRDIPRMVAVLEQGHDLVCGWRRDRKDRWLSRVLPSRIANWLIAGMTGIPIHDTGCSLKAYRAELTRSLRLYSDMHRFLPAVASIAGARISEIEVRHHPRTRGTNKYGISRTFTVIADVITMKMLVKYASRPAIWFGLLSIPWVVIGAAATAGWFLGLSVFDEPDSIVLPGVALISLYLGGSLATLGMLGEIYLAHGDLTYLHQLVSSLSASDLGSRQGDPS